MPPFPGHSPPGVIAGATRRLAPRKMRLVSDHAEADLADRADAECSISVCPRVLCMPDRTDGLAGAVQHAQAFLSSLDQRPAAPRADASRVREALGGALPERGEDPTGVIDALVTAAEPGLVASAGPRHF